MGTRLFVGNLSYNVTELELREAFTAAGVETRSVRVALDRETGRPRGFAFVETATDEDAKKSIAQLSGQLLQGRAIVIEEAQARGAPGTGPRPAGPPRSPGAPGGYGGGGGGGGFGGPRPPGSGFGAPRPEGAGGFPPRPGGFPPRPGEGAPEGGFSRPAGPGPGSGGDDARRFDKKAKAAEKKRTGSTRPKPEDSIRGNWRWNGGIDED